MANFYELPVYKKAIDLATTLTRSTNKTDKDIRFTRVTGMKNRVMDIAKTIAFANGEPETPEVRMEYIDKCLDALHDIEIDVRVLKDANLITKSGFNAIAAAEGRLGRQLIGWKNATAKKMSNTQE